MDISFTPVATSSGNDNTAPIPTPDVDRWFTPWGNVNGTSVSRLSTRHGIVNAVYYTPIKLTQTASIDTIGLALLDKSDVTDTWSYKFALYTENGEGYPAAKITDLCTLTVDGETETGPVLGSASATLQGGVLYWLGFGIHCDGDDGQNNITPKFVNQTGDFIVFKKRGLFGPSAVHPGIAWLESINAWENGEMPASTSYANNIAATELIPRIALRRSA